MTAGTLVGDRAAVGRSRFAHPEGFDDDLSMAAVATMVQRALNCVDPRLVDHGVRVAALLDAMLEADGSFDEGQRRAAYLVALLHDIGAYRTEEIDRLVMFETGDVWEHSFYGYLFCKELLPLGAYAELVLYHHLPYDRFVDQDPQVRFLSSALHVADRVDVLMLERQQVDGAEVQRLLGRTRSGEFSPEALALFAEAERRCGIVEQLRDHAVCPNPLHLASDPDGIGTAVPYLDLLVHVIDFRSHHTVTHTVTTAWVAYELALRLLDDRRAAARVYAAALVHDVGKIGTPLAILEKPGRLDAEEMAVMRMHVTQTERILTGCVDDDLLHAASRHHEKLDGSGYPRGLRAEQLTMPDRIVAVADIVSALVGTRSYKEAYPKERVLEVLATQSAAGAIDALTVDVMERDYDAIMDTVAQACRPVAEAYRRVKEQYAWLLEQLGKARGADEGSGA